MTRQLNIAGKNSNEIYTLFYPNNLINFCKYDFSLFLDHCTDLCRLAARTGEYNVEDVYSIRNSISGCHKYYEQNMRTVFEKIVVDCWIDYLCKQSDIGVNTLWQSFMKCRNPFEQAIFNRLSEYRYNRAINEWTNLLKMQEYARAKVDFVFGVRMVNFSDASARANYFDLVFNVASNEQGFPVTEIGGAGIYSVGRLPNSPFVMSTAAREIARNQLKNMEYRDTPYKSRKNPDLTDKTAMDAFDAIKEYIPDKNDSMAKTIIKSMSGMPNNVYMPTSFKAVIDLEIDASAQSGALIQKCARCGDYYIRDEEYNYDYCDKPQREGLSCLEIMKRGEDGEIVLPPAVEEEEDDFRDDDINVIYVDKETVDGKMEVLYKEMAARVNVDLTQRDFSRWYQKELRLKERILLGEAGEKELNEFIELSRGDEFASKKQPPVFEPQKRPEKEEPKELTENGKEIKKFVFEKIERKPEPQAQAQTLEQSEKAAMEAVQRLLGAGNVKPHPAQRPQQPVQSYAPPAYVPPQGYQYPQQPQNYQQIPPNYQPQQSYPQQPNYANYYGQQFRQQPVSRVIRGSAQNQSDYPVKPKSIIIPTESQASEFTPIAKSASENEEEVKVFTPKKEAEVKVHEPITASPDEYIELSPYEKLKQPLMEHKNEVREETPEPEVNGQISTDDIAQPKPIPASAMSAYKNIGLSRTAELPSEQPEKADFSKILDSIKREDGFEKEEAVDADGIPVSHKTKHVMNALFGPTKASPFLKINLDDDDE